MQAPRGTGTPFGEEGAFGIPHWRWAPVTPCPSPGAMALVMPPKSFHTDDKQLYRHSTRFLWFG